MRGRQGETTKADDKKEADGGRWKKRESRRGRDVEKEGDKQRRATKVRPHKFTTQTQHMNPTNSTHEPDKLNTPTQIHEPGSIRPHTPTPAPGHLLSRPHAVPSTQTLLLCSLPP